MSDPAGRSLADRTRSSMSLLDEIAEGALEPAYLAAHAAEAEATAAGREPPRRASVARRTFHVGLVVVLAAAGFLLALAVADVRRDAPAAAEARNELASRVQERTTATDALSDEVRALRSEVSRARDEELATTRSGRERAEALTQLELATGAAAVTGPGARVTVDDAPSAPDASENADLGVVQDRDLQLVVNGLWAAGAEAIAVNGYRITARSAIRSAGESILVDFRPVSPPYRVEAIGEEGRLAVQFADGPGGRALSTLNSTYGIRFSSESVARLTLPAAVSLGDVTGSTSGGTS